MITDTPDQIIYPCYASIVFFEQNSYSEDSVLISKIDTISSDYLNTGIRKYDLWLDKVQTNLKAKVRDLIRRGISKDIFFKVPTSNGRSRLLAEAKFYPTFARGDAAFASVVSKDRDQLLYNYNPDLLTFYANSEYKKNRNFAEEATKINKEIIENRFTKMGF